MIPVGIYAPAPEFVAQAQALASELGLPLLDQAWSDHCAACLIPTAKGLQIQAGGAASVGPILVDFGSGGMRHRRRSGQNELLGRAVGVGKREKLRAVDATAGLGRQI